MTTSAANDRVHAVPISRRHSYGIDEPAGFCNGGKVVVRIAEHRIDHADALEIVADLVFLGHADAAVELDRLLADIATRTATLDLGGGDGAAALTGVRRFG